MGLIKAIQIEQEKLRSLFIDWLGVASTLYNEHGYTALEAIEAAKKITLTEPEQPLLAARMVENVTIHVPLSDELVAYYRPETDGERRQREYENWLFDPENRDDYIQTDGGRVYIEYEQPERIPVHVIPDVESGWLRGEVEIDEC